MRKTLLLILLLAGTGSFAQININSQTKGQLDINRIDHNGVWTGAKCVRVSNDGLRLEAAANDCGTGGGGGTPGGSNTQIQFNDSSAFGGDSGLVYNKTTDVLTAVNVQTKGQPVFDVKAYGATGDGVTNDTTAMQAAITAASAAGGKVFLPQGTYHINTGGQLLISGNDVIVEGVGDASLIDAKAETSTTQTIRVTGSRVELRNFKILGSRFAGGGSGNATTVAFISGTRGVIHDVNITKSGSHAVFAQDTSEFYAFRNKISDVGGSCIWTEGDRDGEWIADNICNLAAQTVGTQAGAIHNKAGTTRNVTDIHILHNRITSSGSTGIVVNPTSFRAQGVEILSNYINITGTRSLAAGIAGEGMALTGDRLQVNGNYVGKAYVQGILFWGSITDSVALGNFIWDSSQDASGGHAAIETVANDADISSDGKITRLTIGDLSSFDDQGGSPTQLRPVRVQIVGGGTYGSDNQIYGIKGSNNISTDVDFGTSSAQWLMYGSQPSSALLFGLNNGLVLSGDITPSQITADQNNYDPSGWNAALVLRLSTNASRNITGLNRGQRGRMSIIQNVGSFPIVLADESASSTAGNRFSLGGIPVTIPAGQSAILQYDSTISRWKMIAGGNAQTATAFPSDPTNCSAGNYPLGVDASGNVQSCTAASGAGTVTSFSAGNLSPLFTTSVATATTTPALTFALSTAAAHTFFGNNTGSTAAPGFQAITDADVPDSITISLAAAATALAANGINCTAGQAPLGVDASGNAEGCFAPGGGSPAFDAITTGTNTTATMTVGTGGSIVRSGTGTIDASKIGGIAVTGTPGVGQIPIATSSSAAAWADPLVSGIAAHDAAGAAINPVAIGCYGNAAAPANVSTDVDIVRTWCLLNGSQVTNIAVGGTLIDPRVITTLPALPANQSVNNAQINGVTPLMGNGVTGTGSQRVTIASDNTAFAVNNTQQGTASQNVAQIAGSAISSGNGNAGPGSQRVTIAADNTAFGVLGTKTNNNAAPGATNFGVLPSVATAAEPAYTEGNQVGGSSTLTGQFRVVNKNSDAVGTLVAMNALNTRCSVALAGQSGASMSLAAGTLIGTIVPEISYDNGTTWVQSEFWNQINDEPPTFSIVYGSANAATFRAIIAGSGVTNASVRVSAFTSGTANCTVRGTATETEVVNSQKTDGSKFTYRVSATGQACVASATAPCFSIYGSATKTIRITHIKISATAATAALENVQVSKFSTAISAGTSTALVAVPMDSLFPATTATNLLKYTAAPTPGTLVGAVCSQRGLLGSATVTGNFIMECNFGDYPGGAAVVLRGTAQGIGVLTTIAATVDFEAEYTEETP